MRAEGAVVLLKACILDISCLECSKGRLPFPGIWFAPALEGRVKRVSQVVTQSR